MLPHLSESLKMLKLGKEFGLTSTNLSNDGQRVFQKISKEIQEAKPIERESVLAKVRRNWRGDARNLVPSEQAELRRELNEKFPRLGL